MAAEAVVTATPGRNVDETAAKEVVVTAKGDVVAAKRGNEVVVTGGTEEIVSTGARRAAAGTEEPWPRLLLPVYCAYCPAVMDDQPVRSCDA